MLMTAPLRVRVEILLLCAAHRRSTSQRFARMLPHTVWGRCIDAYLEDPGGRVVDPIKHSIPKSELAGSISFQAAIVGASPLAKAGQGIQTKYFLT